MKTLLVTTQLTSIYRFSSTLDPTLAAPQVIATSVTPEGTAFDLRQLEVGDMVWIEQHLKTHKETNPEMLVCIGLPNKREVLDKFKTIVYHDCDEVNCDCNKEWPWLKHIREPTSLLPVG